MKMLLILSLLSSLNSSAQQTLVDSLKEKMFDYMRDSTQLNQLIATCEEIVKLDRKTARNSHVYVHLTTAYFKIGDSKKALKTAKKVTPLITLPRFSRKTMNRNIDSRNICYQRYEYYHKTGQHKKAYKNLSLMFRKYIMEHCGTGRENRDKRLRQRMIDCLEESGKCRKAARLRKKVYI
jgi:tetratricopeptide (TPR) repeat protein